MKVTFLAAMCALFSLSIFGQSTTDQSDDPAKRKEKAGVEEISLARDDGSGKPGEVKDSFASADVPLHCLIKLDSSERVLVKINVVAVEAAGYKAESVVVSVSYKTDGNQNRVNFRVSPGGKLWTSGNYRVDVYTDGVKSADKSFEIAKLAGASEAKNPVQPKQPKTVRRARKH